ncbi:HAMP domain-containing histidine kinase [Streptomyces sp. Je 1-79]|uniref:sensor histidine kinase n=1 Tax=Streptomyces sp. Je 1-79 TaxID=2943847 RepID=UPI0021A8B09A|nr:HAMP domain-containing histidine kinase [Streptomyces sp. Je 1-79]MCT4357520.1 HAMP domain-containing histidine kinase [Streptomyces sp. Je 1-79]
MAATARRLTGGERARLTALYGGLLLLAGALLTGVVYFLVKEGLYASISVAMTTAVPAQRLDTVPATPRSTASPLWEYALPTSPGPVPPGVAPGVAITRTLSDAAESAALERLLTVSLIVLAVYAVVSVVLAWWMAGRVLRPVAVITDTARRLSGENLHERIALDGPPGELKHLADTFDDMLGRMERLVSSQQRFAANAAHELRTALAVQRAAAEIGLAGEPDAQRVARIRGKLLEVADDSERTIDGLLLLAACDQGLRERRPVAVHELARKAVEALASEAEARAVTVAVDARPLTVPGDTVLLDRLLHNLVGNAVRHNVAGGRVRVRTGPDGIEVANTGPAIPPDVVPLLFEPFRRLTERTHAPGEGVGLGLSIVESIARAHGATAEAFANTQGGGLTVRVHFTGARGGGHAVRAS